MPIKFRRKNLVEIITPKICSYLLSYYILKNLLPIQILIQIFFLFLSITGYRMPAPECATPEIYRLMLECWHMDPIRRPTFEVIQRKLEDIFKLDSND